MEPVGLSKRVGLLEVGEPRIKDGDRLILEGPASPFRDEEELTRKERRSSRDPAASPTGPASPVSLSLIPRVPVSGRELNSGRWAVPFSSFRSEFEER